MKFFGGYVEIILLVKNIHGKLLLKVELKDLDVHFAMVLEERVKLVFVIVYPELTLVYVKISQNI